MKVAVIGAGSKGKRHLTTLYDLSNSEGINEIRCFDKNEARISEATTE